ncbi:MAG: PAS domain S-box protein, partial [Clostridiaceae bacterium]|nr:PAS domain S-box protein [Clostridiaceae bacterium]
MESIRDDEKFSGSEKVHESFEQKFNQVNDLLKYIVEHMRGSVAVHDRDLRYIYVSKKYLEIYGLEGQNIIGKHHYEVFPDMPQVLRDAHESCLQGEVVGADEDIFVREDGTKEITRWECRPWFATNNTIGGMIVFTEIITKQKAIERELIASKERYLSVFNDAPIGIALIDSITGNYIEVNPELCNITGRSQEEMLKICWQDITLPEDISQDHKMMNQLLGGKVKNYSVRKRYFRPDGQTVWVRNTVTPYRHADTPCHLVMVIDISDIVKRQERVEYLSNHDP